METYLFDAKGDDDPTRARGHRIRMSLHLHREGVFTGLRVQASDKTQLRALGCM
jgi:hypothetical protein